MSNCTCAKVPSITCSVHHAEAAALLKDKIDKGRGK